MFLYLQAFLSLPLPTTITLPDPRRSQHHVTTTNHLHLTSPHPFSPQHVISTQEDASCQPSLPPSTLNAPPPSSLSQHEAEVKMDVAGLWLIKLTNTLLTPARPHPRPRSRIAFFSCRFALPPHMTREMNERREVTRLHIYRDAH